MEKIIAEALRLASHASETGETPVGAVVFNSKTKQILCGAHNLVITNHDATAHAEVLAVREAGKLLGNYNLAGYSIFSTLEPCAMCGCAISWAHLDKLYFGAYDPKSGAIEHGPHLYQCATCHHKPEVIGGFHEKECQLLMTRFFKGLRNA